MTSFKEEYPKTYKLFAEYLTEELKKQGGAPEILGAFPIDKMIAMAIQNRVVYDALDSLGYIVSVFYNRQTGWSWQIDSPNGYKTAQAEGGRRGAEAAGFKVSFELIEKS